VITFSADFESTGKVIGETVSAEKALAGRGGLVEGQDTIIGDARENTSSMVWGTYVERVLAGLWIMEGGKKDVHRTLRTTGRT